MSTLAKTPAAETVTENESPVAERGALAKPSSDQ